MYASCVEKRRRVNWGSGPLYERICASQKVSPHALYRDPAGVSTDAADIDVASVVGFALLHVSRFSENNNERKEFVLYTYLILDKIGNHRGTVI